VKVNQLRRVLVAVDFSGAARAAFDRALALSRAHDAELTLVHAVATGRPFEWYSGERVALLAGLRQKAAAADVRVKVRVRQGDPASVILRHAEARQVDLIVLGTSERSALDRLRFGSVSETVVRDATRPVLVVPSTATELGEAAWPYSNVLVAVDFSEGSKAAVEKAVSMANGNSRVTLVHVVRGVPPASASRYMYNLIEPEYQRQLARDAWRRIPEMIPVSANTTRKVHARVVAGDPSTEIARVAAEVDADLILVGVGARGIFGQIFRSSTAARVVRTAGRAVLAIPELSSRPIADESQAARPVIAA
jgi:nucleotide-binding universal stress UspA family protein